MRASRVEGLAPAAPLRWNAARIVQTRLEELVALSEPALEPGAVQAQHDMRIAAKRLRYVLELVAPCFGEPAEGARATAKELQQVLGDLRDCDVLIPRAAGIPSLEAVLRQRRGVHYARFRALWSAHADNGTWAELGHLL